MRKEFLKWATGDSDDLVDKIVQFEWELDDLQQAFYEKYNHFKNTREILDEINNTLTSLNKVLKLIQGGVEND